MLQLEVKLVSVIYCQKTIHSLILYLDGEMRISRLYSTAQESAAERLREFTPYKERNAPAGKF
jgi:hypothetical protein